MAFDTSDKIGFIPIHFAVAILPVGFILISIRFVFAANQKKQVNNFLILTAFPLGLIASLKSFKLSTSYTLISIAFLVEE